MFNDDPHLSDDLWALELLADVGYLDREKAEFGIAKLFVHEGEDAMTTAQLLVFRRHVKPKICRACEICGDGIELSTLPDAYEQGLMLCSYHLYRHHKEAAS